ncbi:MAG TPA: amino acid adenylation domain-containing protein, partial [Thermoanaerobaculia bacterium]
LMRVMLGGHPDLFAPPELELLSFNTLAERKAAFSGRDSFWLEGLLRALMEVRGCGAEEARTLMEQMESEGLSTAEMYRRLQEWLGRRMLVDKTPSYALDPAILRRAEEAFDQPRYIHLIRHPLGMIRSFEEAKLDQIFFRHEHPFSRRALAELIWLASERNIIDFLQEIPPERQHWVRFEELVREPERVLSGICAFLGLDYHPDMALPYKAKSERMTDGIHAESRMLGDVKFHQHRDVDAAVAERWREELSEDSLGQPTRQTAAQLGYNVQGQQPQWTRIEPAACQPGELIPLSFAQERLWFLDRLAPGSPAYSIPAALRLRGRLNWQAMELSLREIVRRHAVLRTRFVMSSGQPAQVVDPAHGFSVPLIDLSGLPERDREAETARLVGRDARLSFDLAHGPLFRASLLRLDAEDHATLLAMHHIVSDGWSMGVLIREMAALYVAFSQGRRSPLPELEIQYADYARWQRGWLQGEILEREISFWRQALAGAPVLELPTDRPRPPVQTFRGARRGVFLTPSISAALTALGHREGVSLYMSLLAGFATLLSRYSGQEDVSIGSPTANRTRAQVEGLIGFFVNALVLRTDLSGEPSFRQLLGRVRKAALDAFTHQELPFEKVVEELQPQRDLSRSPLFQVMFTLQNASSERLELPGLSLSPLTSGATVAKFDLTLALRQVQDGIGGSLEYNTDLFDEPIIGRMAKHVESLLAAAAADPDRPFPELPLLSDSEHDQILRAWNATESDFPEIPVHRLFEWQAEISPGATALVAADEQLTYAELSRRANRLAHHLRRMGVGPEVLVGVSLERSAELVVTLLGILKAGGAYLPLDPSYPRERLRMVLEDARASVLLTSRELAGSLFTDLPVSTRVVCLDSGEILDENGISLPDRVEPDNLAYALFTSGSTGRPKGVAVSHRALVNFLTSMRQAPGIEKGERLLGVTSLSFDIAALEIFLPLLAGGCVELATREQAADGAWLATRLAAEASPKIHVLQATPSTWRLLLDTGWPGDPDLKALCGGEALPRDLASALRERVGELWNLYGPTETTVWSAAASLARGETGPVPIGRPIANTRIYLLDRNLRPAPPSAAGRLHIGGAGVARGYLGRPDLTVERFVPDPISPLYGGEPGARLYDTGDLARLRPDGTLEFLGRVDHQVKIRGFRIELGEIEAALSRYPGVSQAVVVVRDVTQDDRRLAAYVVPANGATPQPLEMRDHLRSKLPEYMIPSAWAILTALPLTPNGKVDRKALPVPEQTAAKKAAYVAPASSLEKLIAGIWQDVLGVDTVGIHDNFFDLGGHSLLMARVQGHLSELLGREIGLVDLFSYPTIGSLARFLSPKESEGALQARVEAEEVEQIEVGMARAKQLRRSRREVDI